MIQQLTKFFKLIRWKNVVIFIILQALIYFVLFQHQFQITDGWLFLVLSMTFFGIFGNLQNNIADYEHDKLKSGFIKFDITSYLIITIIIFVLAALFGITAFYMSFAPSLLYFLILIPLLLSAYNYYLKKIGLIGNLIIAVTTTLAIFIPIYFNKQEFVNKPEFTFLLTMAFFLTLIREITKDLEDKNIDKQAGYKTLAVLDEKITQYIIVLFSLFTLYAAWSFNTSFGSINFYILFLIIALLLGFNLMLIFKKRYTLATKLLKLLMIVGIFAVFII